MSLTLSFNNATNTVKSYLSESKVAVIFLVVISLIFLLNLTKRILTVIYSKREKENNKCRYLQTGGATLKCEHPSHEKQFEANNGSCENCSGKLTRLSKDELELKASKASKFHFGVFLIANYGKSMLPYISFLFSLIVAAYVSKSK